VGRSGGKSYLDNKGVEGIIILKLMFMKRNEEAWSALLWLGIGTDGGLL